MGGEASRFHFLKLAWRSATEDWKANLLFLLLSPLLFSLIASGVGRIPIPESETEGFRYVLWFVFYLCSFCLFAMVDDRVFDPTIPLPISRRKRSLLLLVESLLQSTLVILPLAVVILAVAGAGIASYVGLLVLFGLAKTAQGVYLAMDAALERVCLTRITAEVARSVLLVGGIVLVAFVLTASTSKDGLTLGIDSPEFFRMPSLSTVILLFVAVLFSWGISWWAACFLQSLPYVRQKVSAVSVPVESRKSPLLRASDVTRTEPGNAGCWAYLHPWVFIPPAFLASALVLSVPFWAIDLFHSTRVGTSLMVIVKVLAVVVTPFLIWTPVLIWTLRMIHLFPFWQIHPVTWKWPVASVGVGLATVVVGILVTGLWLEASFDSPLSPAVTPEQLGALGLLLIPVGAILVASNDLLQKHDATQHERFFDFMLCQWPIVFVVALSLFAKEILGSASIYLIVVGIGFAYNLWAMAWMYRRY